MNLFSGNSRKIAIGSLVLFLLLLVSCSPTTNSQTIEKNVSFQELILTSQEVSDLGLSAQGSCQIENLYGICNYTINDLGDTEVIIQLQEIANKTDLNGSYQYQSLHLRGYQGLIEENTMADQSRFYVNNESATFYYHLWMTKDDYLIHITSKGSEQARDDILAIGEEFLTKFE
ncbi:MAG: hypothetical protein KC535_05470 [Nanoarchaeota archaeon]|nr:hypothetical protein [Nanoarchaeota archaeon]